MIQPGGAGEQQQKLSAMAATARAAQAVRDLQAKEPVK
jgi:hypothetical protein